jgi:hypothetical protein
MIFKHLSTIRASGTARSESVPKITWLVIANIDDRTGETHK